MESKEKHWSRILFSYSSDNQLSVIDNWFHLFLVMLLINQRNFCWATVIPFKGNQWNKKFKCRPYLLWDKQISTASSTRCRRVSSEVNMTNSWAGDNSNNIPVIFGARAYKKSKMTYSLFYLKYFLSLTKSASFLQTYNEIVNVNCFPILFNNFKIIWWHKKIPFFFKKMVKEIKTYGLQCTHSRVQPLSKLPSVLRHSITAALWWRLRITWRVWTSIWRHVERWSIIRESAPWITFPTVASLWRCALSLTFTFPFSLTCSKALD